MRKRPTKLIQKIAATALLVAVLSAGLYTVISKDRANSTNSKGIAVATTFYPLYNFAQQVGGDKIHVTNVTPAGAEPHDYEPSPKTLADTQRAQVFIYNGGELEPWTSGFLETYEHTTVQAGAGVTLLSSAEEGHTHDPHFWLDPVLAQQIVRNIRDGLSKADPTNKDYYAQRATEYSRKLAELDQAFQNGFATCGTRTIITSHDAFSYLGKRYNLDIHSIAGISPEEEPSAAKLAELSQLVREQNIKYVFFESLVSPKLADTIATETGAQTLVLDPIEGLTDEAQQQGADYLSLQRANLANLRTALACQ